MIFEGIGDFKTRIQMKVRPISDEIKEPEFSKHLKCI